MNETLNQFKAIAADPYGSVRGWKKKTGKKVIGVSPMHIPEEIIHAAGILPVVLWESDEPITIANSYSQPTICGYTRSIFDDALKEKLKFIDGMVYHDDCLAQRQFGFLMRRYAKPAYNYLIYVPQVLDEPHSKDNLVKQLRRFSTSLEEFSGQKVSGEKLQQSIVIYNKHRALMRKLYNFRRDNPGVLRAKEVAGIAQASMLMPKEEHSKLLEELLPILEKTKKPSGNGRVRVIVSGCLCRAPRTEILDAIEDAGADVVDDDLYVGARYSVTDAPETGDPYEALADRFVKMKLRCPSKSQDSTDWAKQLVEIAQKSNSKGVVSFESKFCEPHYFFYSHIMQALDKENIRNLGIEIEHETTSARSAQIATRVQAFIESCKGEK